MPLHPSAAQAAAEAHEHELLISTGYAVGGDGGGGAAAAAAEQAERRESARVALELRLQRCGAMLVLSVEGERLCCLVS